MDETFPQVYAVKHKNFDTRINSRSGGFFTAISDIILEDNGTVYGCILENGRKAKHIKATNFTQRNKMRGSKYIQSDLQNIFQSIQDDLNKYKKVLFSGTPCQVAGLKAFLNYDYKNLFCIDLICHGVTSKKLWNQYISWQEKNYNLKCIDAEFRNKKQFDWESHIETLTMEGTNKTEIQISSDIFANIFYNPSSLRPCCYQCPYKSIQRQGDISLGDYWGIDNILTNFNDHKGISLVLVNNEHGKKIFKKAKKYIIFKTSHIKDCIQKPLKESLKKPPTRKNFWIDFYNESFEIFIHKNIKLKNENEIKKEYYRLKMYNFLLEQWLNNHLYGYQIYTNLEKKDYKNIAIYGNGVLGKFLIEEFKKSSINICYCIDQFSNEKITYYNIPIIKIKEILNQNTVDAIIISPIHKESEIRMDLAKNNVTIKLISLIELIFDEYL